MSVMVISERVRRGKKRDDKRYEIRRLGLSHFTCSVDVSEDPRHFSSNHHHQPQAPFFGAAEINR
jgi:hypothetical protein